MRPAIARFTYEVYCSVLEPNYTLVLWPGQFNVSFNICHYYQLNQERSVSSMLISCNNRCRLLAAALLVERAN